MISQKKENGERLSYDFDAIMMALLPSKSISCPSATPSEKGSMTLSHSIPAPAEADGLIAFKEVRPFGKADLKNVVGYLSGNERYYDVRASSAYQERWGGQITQACANSLASGGEVASVTAGITGRNECVMNPEDPQREDQQISTSLLTSAVVASFVRWTPGVSVADVKIRTGGRKPGMADHGAKSTQLGGGESGLNYAKVALCVLDRVCEWQAREMYEQGYMQSGQGGPMVRLASPAEFESAQLFAANIIKSNLDAVPHNLPAEIRIDAARSLFVFLKCCRHGQKVRILPVYKDGGDAINMYAVHPTPDPMIFKEDLLLPLMTHKDHRGERIASTTGFGPHGERCGLRDVPHPRGLHVCDGASLLLTILNPRVELQLNPVVTKVLKYFMHSPTPADEKRFLAAAGAGRFVVMVRKCWGLTHPDHPFCVARDVVFVDDPAMISRMFAVSSLLGLGLTRNAFDFQHAVVPFTFPPAVDDADADLQQRLFTHGTPFADETQALDYFARQVRGVDLLALTDAEFEQALVAEATSCGTEATGTAGDADAADQARRALRALRLREIVHATLRRLYDRVVAEVVYARKIRDEQNAVSERWNVAAAKKSKNKRKRAAARQEASCSGSGGGDGQNEEQPSVATRIRGIVGSFAQKVCKYRNYKKAINALNSHGMLEAFELEKMRGPHRVLHGSDCSSMTIVEPHGSAKEHSRTRFMRAFGC